MATPLPPGMQQFFDSDGAPLAAGLVYFYEIGTSTPKDTYQDLGQTILNQNPVTLDASGRAIIFGSGAYRQQVFDSAGNLQWDQSTYDTYGLVDLVWCGTAGGTGDAITLTPSQPVVEVAAPLRLVFIAAAANPGPATINVSGNGAVSLLKMSVAGPVALTGGEIQTGNIVEAFFDGTRYLITAVVDTPTARSWVIWGGTPGGSANDITLPTTDPVVTSYASPMLVLFVPTSVNTEAVTLNLDGLGQKNLYKRTGAGPAVMTGGELIPDVINVAAYNGVQFELLTDPGEAPTTFSGIVNLLRNGTFDIWQRGTSGTITAGSPAYSADGWILSSTTSDITWAQASPRQLTEYSLQLTGSAGVTATYIRQRIESYVSARCVGASGVVFQAWIYNGSGADITPTITVLTPTAMDNWGATTTVVNAQNLQSCTNGQWTQVAYCFAGTADMVKGLSVQLDFGTTLNSALKTIKFVEADLQVANEQAPGLVSVPPGPELRPLSFERNFCERYFLSIAPNKNPAPISPMNLYGIALLATGCPAAASGLTASYAANVQFRQQMRTAPTGITVSNAAHFNYAPAFSAASTESCTMTLTGAAFTVNFAAPPPTSYTVTQNGIFSAVSTSAYLWFTGAEL